MWRNPYVYFYRNSSCKLSIFVHGPEPLPNSIVVSFFFFESGLVVCLKSQSIPIFLMLLCILYELLCCYSCRWGETMFPNCGHQRTCCSSPDDIWVWRATVEWCIDRGKAKNSDRNVSQCHFVHHKSLVDWHRREPDPPRWEAGDWPPELWHGRRNCFSFLLVIAGSD
jgi:hypothetical protein